MLNVLLPVRPLQQFLIAHLHHLGLALVMILFMWVSSTDLSHSPILDPAQTGIAAPAARLARSGVYGNELYSGFYEAEIRNYEYQPLYPLLVAGSFALFGVGIWQARVVSVIFGALTILFTYALGRKVLDRNAGLIAAVVIAILPIAVPGKIAGHLYPGPIPLLDLARVIRYDIAVPVGVLAASLAFLGAVPGRDPFRFLAAGALVGAATLAHVYGAFILPVFLAVLILKRWPIRQLVRTMILLLIGFFVINLPWLIYIGQDVGNFQGQMLRHQARLGYGDLSFYLDNLLREPWRYLKLLGGFLPPILYSRPSFWLWSIAVLAGWRQIWKEARASRETGQLFLLISVPIMALELALLISFKRYAYLILLLPFLAVYCGLGVMSLWRWAKERSHVVRAIAWIMLAWVLLDTLDALNKHVAAAESVTPFEDIAAEAQMIVPEDVPLIIHHRYWFGFQDRPTYSLGLISSLANPAFSIESPRAVAAIMDSYRPFYSVLNLELLENYVPFAAGGPKNDPHQTEAIHRYYLEFCELIYYGETDLDYGTLIVYACE
jgi:4-amino-4-deoxy-L-arabinose transferase-like glycosyltransferase